MLWPLSEQEFNSRQFLHLGCNLTFWYCPPAQLPLGTLFSLPCSFFAGLHFWRQKVTSNAVSSCDGLRVYRRSHAWPVTGNRWSDWVTAKGKRLVRCVRMFVWKWTFFWGIQSLGASMGNSCSPYKYPFKPEWLREAGYSLRLCQKLPGKVPVLPVLSCVYLGICEWHKVERQSFDGFKRTHRTRGAPLLTSHLPVTFVGENGRASAECGSAGLEP